MLRKLSNREKKDQTWKFLNINPFVSFDSMQVSKCQLKNHSLKLLTQHQAAQH